MVTKKRTISVRLDEVAKRRVEQAARLSRQSAGAFLKRAGEEEAHSVLLSWARNRYHEGGSTASELAAETGLAVEEIMIGDERRPDESALQAFLKSCEAAAKITDNAEFLRTAKRAVEAIRAEHEPAGNG